ncbi:hypothetical protein [Actinacidiphila acidipaludis]|uniref:ESAT-6 protein secretion system EspG family protein n=1 Tax=Actinacidiphila acidipaludis TaxID=2873382 RepID=A0ABS7Q6S2_9ACTN|nr:hypothetical protein [Streptomyces acidipaludis]MBY8878843.1 hypothetical protein [Streptomyces acidipaludis]
MSFDLGVWFEEVRPERAAAAETYRRLCEGEAGAVQPAAGVAEFHAALVAAFPEPADDDAAGASPWSAGLSAGDGYVLMAMGFGHVDEVAPRVVELAGEHGLLCFDPQAGVVHAPPALRAPNALRLQSCAGLPVADPDLETVEGAVRGLADDNWFVILEAGAGRFVQAGVGASAGVAEGGFAVEYRDGAPERHYRAELSGTEQVVSLFADFAAAPATRPAGTAWERLFG